MQLLTREIRNTLLASGQAEGDHWPVVKLFAPTSAATWLFSELEPDGDRLFGLADLGFGSPELGVASLAEIEGVRLPLGLSIERDLHFEAAHPLSVYAEAARMRGHITCHPDHLTCAARALAAAARGAPP
ncbi:MAG: DUF2958 domain-containing protein [Erythrobacter sp.]|uniref:DUF2958 domain-containing protein n=1 Tax=Erythrobacter sp. TaxID=1042 RepID=UPI001B2E5225|nr:DUF2958 domain-containing protein [Erythrobacter sp.]MBO6767312.1 DUF2958 domain-containing protein [Erythrobacter sp.]